MYFVVFSTVQGEFREENFQKAMAVLREGGAESWNKRGRKGGTKGREKKVDIPLRIRKKSGNSHWLSERKSVENYCFSHTTRASEVESGDLRQAVFFFVGCDATN